MECCNPNRLKRAFWYPVRILDLRKRGKLGWGELVSIPVWRAAVVVTWDRILEPEQGEEDICKKGGLGQ